ncbi:hypothetical protein EDC01DRAFT_243160 [Geopyxis carbonaria]|nr:hypothetical protein EDC01DRAFT_243160 [Geopyxis carbonaria]
MHDTPTITTSKFSWLSTPPHHYGRRLRNSCNEAAPSPLANGALFLWAFRQSLAYATSSYGYITRHPRTPIQPTTIRNHGSLPPTLPASLSSLPHPPPRTILVLAHPQPPHRAAMISPHTRALLEAFATAIATSLFAYFAPIEGVLAAISRFSRRQNYYHITGQRPASTAAGAVNRPAVVAAPRIAAAKHGVPASLLATTRARNTYASAASAARFPRRRAMLMGGIPEY